MADNNLSFSKIVANPTPTSWSQAYSAGRLFAVFSLNSQTPPQEEEGLAAIGKNLISTLEQEFFTLEQKTLESIKQAVTTTSQKATEGITLSFVVCYLQDNILYLFSLGGGRAVLKRKDKIGTVIEANEPTIKSASGYVQDDDIIILETSPFQKVISTQVLAESLDSSVPSEIADALNPHLHQKEEGGAAAVILSYKKVAEEPTAVAMDASNEAEQEASQEKPEEIEEGIVRTPQTPEETPKPEEEPVAPIPASPTATSDFFPPDPMIQRDRARMPGVLSSLTQKIPRDIKFGLTHSRRLLLTVAVIIGLVLVSSSFLAIRSRDSAKTKALFASIYDKASEKFEEGKSLKDVNASLARESFAASKSILEDGKDQFKEQSKERKQIDSLLTEVNSEMSQASEAKKVAVKGVSTSDSAFLSAQIGSNSKYFAQNDKNLYILGSKGLVSIDKGNEEEQTIIDKTWGQEGGLGLFLSNIYILDKTEGQLLKFIPAGDKYQGSDYFSDTKDFSNVSAMTIDGAVYILFKDGTIKKYLRGEDASFNIKGLAKPLSSPTRIFTDADTTNLYVLDQGRVVVFDKEGTYKNAYQADVLKDAKDFEVLEKENKILVLSGDKIYQLDLK